MGEKILDLLLTYPDKVALILLTAACIMLWRAWRSERVERNLIQQARIDDLKGALDANTRASAEQAAASKAIADQWDRLRTDMLRPGSGRARGP